MKKEFRQFLAFLLISSAISTPIFAASIFKDVPETHWGYKYMVEMKKNGYIPLSSNGEFFPNQIVSYFELADILAKVTGYKDETINKNMDESLKESIRNNYKKQEPHLKQAQATYKSWDESKNEEIAYLIGRGYFSLEDLKLFVSVQNGKEVHNIIKKQDLAKYLVRIIQKEKTALSEYNDSVKIGFSDENLISETNKPYVAYLKKLGVINGNGSAFGANDNVTRAVLSKMIIETLNKAGTATAPTTPTTQGKIGTIQKIIEKNDKDYYVLIETKENRVFFYTVSPETVIKQNDQPISINQLKIGSEVEYVIENKNQTEYLSHIKVLKDGHTNNQTTPAPEKPQTPDIPNSSNNPSNTTAKKEISGTVASIEGNFLTIEDSKGQQTFALDKNCKIYINGYEDELDQIQLDSDVTAIIQNNLVIEIEVEQEEKQKEESLEVELIDLLVRENASYIKVKEKSKIYDLTIPKNVEIVKGDKILTSLDLKIGDVLLLTVDKKENVSHVEVLSKEQVVTGAVKEVNISQNPYIVILDEQNKENTFYVSLDTDIYDAKERKDILLQNISVGMQVEVEAENKHAIAITKLKESKPFVYKGRIQEIGSRNQYLDIVIDYDPLTEETMIVKRMSITDTDIEKNGKLVHRKELEVGQEVLITLNSFLDKNPSKIMIIN